MNNIIAPDKVDRQLKSSNHPNYKMIATQKHSPKANFLLETNIDKKSIQIPNLQLTFNENDKHSKIRKQNSSLERFIASK